jgi:hypothetical protein
MHTSCERLPFARLVVLALRQSDSQHLKAILHFAAAFSLGQFMCYAQLGGPAVRGRVGHIGFGHEAPHLFVLERVMMYILGQFCRHVRQWGSSWSTK